MAMRLLSGETIWKNTIGECLGKKGVLSVTVDEPYAMRPSRQALTADFIVMLHLLPLSAYTPPKVHLKNIINNTGKRKRP